MASALCEPWRTRAAEGKMCRQFFAPEGDSESRRVSRKIATLRRFAHQRRAAREITEQDLFQEAQGQAREKLPKGCKGFADKASLSLIYQLHLKDSLCWR